MAYLKRALGVPILWSKAVQGSPMNYQGFMYCTLRHLGTLFNSKHLLSQLCVVVCVLIQLLLTNKHKNNYINWVHSCIKFIFWLCIWMNQSEVKVELHALFFLCVRSIFYIGTNIHTTPKPKNICYLLTILGGGISQCWPFWVVWGIVVEIIFIDIQRK